MSSWDSAKSWLIVSAIGGFFFLLFLRAFDLQVVHGNDYLRLADNNRMHLANIPPERGVFLDRYGDNLVFNHRSYFEYTQPDQVYSLTKPLPRETALAKLTESEMGVGYSIIREYPYSTSLAHVLGYTGSVTTEDLLKDSALEVSDRVGKMGLEKTFDERLRGKPGKQRIEMNALGKKLQVVTEKEPVPGLVVQTTLDPYLTDVAAKALGQQLGAVVISDAETGEILSLVSSPSFDANAFSQLVIDEQVDKQRAQLLESFFSDQRQVFFNRAVSGAYPPGSIFKLITALGGLEKGSINADTSVNDEGILKVGEYEYANWYYTQYGRTEGSISLIKAIARSNDIYFYKTAEWLGPDSLADMARLFGLGKPTGIELQGETAGIVPDPEWKEKTIGERWYLGNTYHFGIGQGDLLISPIQAAQFVQAIGNQGRLCQPSLIDDPQDQCSEISLQAENLNLVLKGMLDACSSGGTAYPFFAYNQHHRQPELTGREEIDKGAIACKTGTAEFGGADAQGYRKTHGWFVAIVGINPDKIKPATGEAIDETRAQWLEKIKAKPLPRKLVFVVLVESDETTPFKEGSKDASPVVAQLVEWMMGEPLGTVPTDKEILSE